MRAGDAVRGNCRVTALAIWRGGTLQEEVRALLRLASVAAGREWGQAPVGTGRAIGEIRVGALSFFLPQFIFQKPSQFQVTETIAALLFHPRWLL